jgi:hypothetical protein
MGTIKYVTSVTKATQGVALCTAHGLTAGAIGAFNVSSGMIELDGQAARVSAPTTDNFTLQGLDTTPYTTFSTTQEFVPVATWGLLAESISWEEGGGDPQTQDSTRLLDMYQRNEIVGISPMTLGINLKGQSYDSDVAYVIRSAALAGAAKVFRITQIDGSVRVVNGYPSLPTWSLQQGQLATGGFSIVPRGLILNGKA